MSEPRCRGCGYALTGLATFRCPECGRAFDPHDPPTFRSGQRGPMAAALLRVRKHARLIALVVAVATVVGGSWLYLRWRHSEALKTRLMCAAWLHKGIGTTLSIYYQEYDAYPDSFAELVRTVELSPECRRPGSNGGENLGWCYVAGLTWDDPADWMIAFDPPDSIHPGGVRCVAYISAGGRWLTPAEFDAAFARMSAEHVLLKGHPPDVRCP